MPHIAGVKTETTNTQISSKSKKYLAEVGEILKKEEDAENQEFERKWNDPTNLTLDQLQESMLNHLDTLPWKS